MTLFQNKYRIASARLQNWDYANEGLYFITICTKNREHYFGEIENGKMNYSNVGIIADLMWFEIINHFNNIELGEFVIMPNHIHAILNLFHDRSYFIGDNKNDIKGENGGNDDQTNDIDDVGDVGNVETRHALSLQPHKHPPHKHPPHKQPPHKQPQPQSFDPSGKSIGQQRFQNQGKNTVSSIIGSYKSAVTKHAHRFGFEFGWQPRFHDHIIRDAQSFDTITNYIVNNHKNWATDKFFDPE